MICLHRGLPLVEHVHGVYSRRAHEYRSPNTSEESSSPCIYLKVFFRMVGNRKRDEKTYMCSVSLDDDVCVSGWLKRIVLSRRWTLLNEDTSERSREISCLVSNALFVLLLFIIDSQSRERGNRLNRASMYSD